MRLIDADDLIDKWNKLLLKMIPTSDGAHPVDFGVIISEISKQPTIEAVPVVHSYWIDEGVYTTTAYGRIPVQKCWNCSADVTVDDHDSYCPNCGAIMDGEKV